MFERKHLVSGGLITVVILLQSINNVQFKTSADALHNYPYFMSIVSLMVFVIVFGAVFLLQYLWGSVPKEVFEFPLRNYFYISILLAVSHVLLYAAAPNVSGPLQNLLTQAVVVAQFFLSMLLLKKKYVRMHWLAIFIIIAGVLVVFYPSVFHGDSVAKDHTAAGLFWQFSILAWCVLWALNNCQYEVILHGKCDNIAWMNVWVSIFCIPTDAVLIWIVLMTENKTFANEMSGGFRCLVHGYTDDPSDVTCATAFEKWAWYSGVQMFVSFFNLALLKKVDAAVLTMTSAIVLPVTNVLFSSPALMKDEVVALNDFVIAAIVIEAAGLLLWGVADFRSEKFKEVSRVVALDIEKNESKTLDSERDDMERPMLALVAEK